jgi:hypothetical protein
MVFIPYFVGFEVLTAVSTKMAVFWVVAPCSLVEVYQRFRGPCCPHHKGDRLGNNTEIKVGNKGNLYMLENTNQSVDEIIKSYLVVANRLNKMSFFI